jgi:6-phosphogluconolactonase (cycloisomerase 2 family)
MALQAPLSSPSPQVWIARGIFPPLFLCLSLAVTAAAQTPQQQYVFESVPVTSATSQVAAYAKNGQTASLSAVTGSPFVDSLQGGAIAIDALGRFLFVLNPATSNISMYQIDQSTGILAEVPGSPFSTGPTENPSMAAKSPACLAVEKSGQFLYVGYRFGNIVNHGALNEYLIDAANRQLVPLSGQPTLDIDSAPIGMVTDPRGAFLYVGLGLNPSTGMQDAGTIVYSIDPVTGLLLPQGTAGNAISAGRSIAVDPQGRFFFDGWGTTLGTIDSALISPADGTALTGISSVTSAKEIPAAMLTDNNGKFLYVQEGSAAVVYAIDQTTGALMVPPAALAVLNFSPGGAAADPRGPYIYSSQRDGVHGFLIDPQSGSLSEILGSPFGGTEVQGTIAISGSPTQAVSGPVAAIFPASEAFDTVTVGQSGNSKLVTITNTGGQGLSLRSVSVAGVNLSDFVATPNCSLPTVLAPNITCTVSIVFSPSAVGTRQASLAALDNAPGSPQSIPLTGVGSSALPAVTLSPGSLTFATTSQGSTSPAQSVTITNSGAAILHISSILPGGSNPGDFQVSSACSNPVPVAGACNVNVTFSPFGAGQRTANITIMDDAADSPQSVQFTGTGAAAPPGTPIVKLTPANVSFGPVTQGAVVAAQVITLANSGTGPLHIASVTLVGANSSDFRLTNNCAAAAYAAGTTCTIGVSISPVATGARTASVTITDDGSNSPQSIALSATVNAAFAISPAAPGSTSVTVTAGQTALFNLQLTPGAGFTGGASFACAGAPHAATCTAPNAQFTGGIPIAYVVSVATTANTIALPSPRAPRLPPLVRLDLLSLLACCGALVLYISRSHRTTLTAGLLHAAPIVVVALLCIFEVAGCGGAGAAASPQAVLTPPTTGTPSGASTITVTPSVTTSTGTLLPGVPPIQLTLTVQ